MPLNETILNTYKKPIFIETGLQDGESVDFAIRCGFEKIYSIELSQHYISLGLKKYAGNGKVSLIQGDSGVKLGELLSKINESPIIWLDAHPFMEHMPLNMCPLMNELESIKPHYHRLKPTIMVDDLRVFNDNDKKIIIAKANEFSSKIAFLDSRCGKQDILCISY